MGLLLFSMRGEQYQETFQSLPLPDWSPRKFPFTQSVSRIVRGIDPFNYTSVCEPISDIVNMPVNRFSFEEMCLQRAFEMKKLDSNIYIMYSGGIDSTSALVAFLLTWTLEDLKRVFIVTSDESRIEYPEFWVDICKVFEGRILTSFDHVENYCKKGYVITGEHGDQLFGSDVINSSVHHFGYKSIHAPWQVYIPTVYYKMFGSKISNNMIDVYEPLLEYCPFKLKSTFDWLWWFNFTNKWQHVKYRMLSFSPWEDPKNNFKKIIHFYDTPQWQRWSLDNHDKKMGPTLYDYKFVAKDFVIKYTKHESFRNKRKEGSLSNVWNQFECYYAIDTDFNFLTFEEGIKYINKGDKR